MKLKPGFSPWILPLIFVIVAIVMTTYEGVKELLFEGSLTPWESHTITIVFTALLATISASLMRSWVLSIQVREKELELKSQSLRSFELILSAVNHIVNNVLNYFQIIKYDIENKGRIEKETIDLLNESLKEADRQMKLLNKIQNPSDPESYRGIYPDGR